MNAIFCNPFARRETFYCLSRKYRHGFISLKLTLLFLSGVQVCSFAAIESANSNFWHLGTTWVGGVVPGPTDDVVIKPGHTITLSDVRSCAALTIDALGLLMINGTGSLSQTGVSIVNGTLTLSSGALSQNGSFTVNGTFTIAGTASFTQSQAGTLNGIWNTQGTYTFGSMSGFSGPGSIVSSTGTQDFNAGSALPSNVQITGGIVNDNVGFTFTSLVLNGGAFGGSANSFVNGLFTWTVGSLNDSGTLTATGTFTGSGFVSRTVNGSRVLRLEGIGTLTNGTITLLSTSKLQLASGGQLSMINNIGQISLGSVATATIEILAGGSLIKSGSTGVVLQSKVLLDGGNITLNSGDLFSVANVVQTYNNATIILNGGNFNHTTGTYNVTDVAVSGAGTFGATGATINFNSGSTLTSPLSVTSGSFNDNVGVLPGLVTMTGGTYGGSGSPVFGNKFYWTGSGTFDGSGTVSVGDSLLAIPFFFITRTVQGSKVFRIDDDASGVFGGHLTISQTAIFEITDNADVTFNSAAITAQNTSKIRISNGGDLIFSIPGASSNAISGTTANVLEVLAGGELIKQGTGNMNINIPLVITNGNVTVHAGSFPVALSTTHTYTNGTILINDGYFGHQAGTIGVTGTSISGNGEFRVQGGATTLSTGSSLTAWLNVIGGTLTSSVLLNPSQITTSGGTILGVCDISVSGNVTMTDGTISNTGDLDINGTLGWNGGGFGDGTATGTVSITGLTTISNGALKTLRKKTLDFNGSAMCNQGSFTLSHGCIFHIPAGSIFTIPGVLPVSFNGDPSLSNSVQNDGTFIKNGTSTVGFTGFIHFANEGTLQGTGTINFSGFTNSGIVAPGSSPGVFSLNKFSNTNSILKIEVAGTDGPGLPNGHDQLAVTGTPAGLGSTLEIHLINGFVPTQGQSFVIVNFSSPGYNPASFSAIDVFGLPPGYGWTITYNPMNVTITFCPEWYLDVDGDEVGVFEVSQISCTQPPGYVAVAGDDCPLDPLKIAPGICGCGVADTDTDDDGTADCIDDCPIDPNKIVPGICGCGVSDIDTDEDGTADCNDECPLDPLKIAPGICGCGVSDIDTDGDGTADCNDDCPLDPNKTLGGICGCGNPEPGTACNDNDACTINDVIDSNCECHGTFEDTDGDGTCDAEDDCPLDPLKTAPGICGCGISDVDTDGDGTADCNDDCPLDPNKILEGICGCGNPEPGIACNDNDACTINDVIDANCECHGTFEDTDGDGTCDAEDGCPVDPLKIAPGICGCGVSDIDTDGDGTADCNDECPLDPNKIIEGICGCGNPEPGTACNDSDACTINDMIDANCECHGTFEDTDGDGTCDAEDGCVLDPLKIAPGICGCGISDVDTDGDGTADCNDDCPLDPNKVAPGDCGCGNPEPGTACDDGIALTINDMINEECICEGEFIGSGTCDDGIMNGLEEGIDCGGTCPPCLPPDAECGVMYVHVNPNAPDRNGPGSNDIWLIDADDLDAGSTSSSNSPLIEVKRFLTNIAFDWTTNGACIDLTANGGGLSNADKGIVYRQCYPAIPADFNKHKLYKLLISDEFGSNECSGTVKVIPDGGGGALMGPSIQFIIPDTDEYISLDRIGSTEGLIQQSENTLSDLFVFPNPGQHVVQLSWTSGSDEPVTVRMRDITGRPVIVQQYIGMAGIHNVMLDMHDNPAGIYLMQINCGRQVEILKWMKMQE